MRSAPAHTTRLHRKRLRRLSCRRTILFPLHETRAAAWDLLDEGIDDKFVSLSRETAYTRESRGTDRHHRPIDPLSGECSNCSIRSDGRSDEDGSGGRTMSSHLRALSTGVGSLALLGALGACTPSEAQTVAPEET